MADDLNPSDYSDTEETPVVLPQLNKYGKPKRVLTEKQKESLAAARLKGMAKRKELAVMKKKEKEMKDEQFLIQKLELQKRIKDHERKKKELIEDVESEEVIPKKPRNRGIINREAEEMVEKEKTNELEELKKQLELIQKDLTNVKLEQSKPRKKVIKTIIESDLEDEPEEELENKGVPQKEPVIQLSRHGSASSITSDTSITRSSMRRPVMNDGPPPTNLRNPIKKVSNHQSEFTRKMRELFPNYNE
jgi:hypothetical protein